MRYNKCKKAVGRSDGKKEKLCRKCYSKIVEVLNASAVAIRIV